jgi:hypothetical protein
VLCAADAHGHIDSHADGDRHQHNCSGVNGQQYPNRDTNELAHTHRDATPDADADAHDHHDTDRHCDRATNDYEHLHADADRDQHNDSSANRQ